MQMKTEVDELKWRRLTEGLPGTMNEISEEIAGVLALEGYLHLKWPMSMENYELVAARLGSIILRSDVKVDAQREQAQEQVRTVKGRGGIYSPTPLGLHTDPHADLVSWYCVEQDETGGAMLMIRVGDIEQHFSPAELEILSGVELLSPGRSADTGQETFTPVPLLARRNGKRRIFYASWLLRDSYDDDSRQVLEKFVAYLKQKEENELISLPVKKHNSIFIDNGRMLHGRGALPTNSKRHLVRFYLRAA